MKVLFCIFYSKQKYSKGIFQTLRQLYYFILAASPVGLRAYKAISQPKRPKQMLLESENPFVDERPIFLSHLAPFWKQFSLSFTLVKIKNNLNWPERYLPMPCWILPVQGLFSMIYVNGLIRCSWEKINEKQKDSWFGLKLFCIARTPPSKSRWMLRNKNILFYFCW